MHDATIPNVFVQNTDGIEYEQTRMLQTLQLVVTSPIDMAHHTAATCPLTVSHV